MSSAWRTRLPIPVALLFFTSLGIPASAQNASAIVDQYIEAAGGAKAISRIHALTIEGTFTDTSNGTSGTFTFNTRQPNLYYSELVTKDNGWIDAYNGKSAWRENGAGEIATAVGQESAQLEATAQYYNLRMLSLKKNKLAVSILGRAQVRGKDAWRIQVTASNGVTRQVYFDAATHLISEEKAAVGEAEETLYYGDYRTVQGLKVPYQIELQRGGDQYQIAVARVDVNSTLEEHVFDFPRKSQVPVPDLHSLFRKIGENQQAIRKIRQNYAGTRTEEETEYDGNGRVSKSEASQYSFFYLDAEEVSTLVKKNGNPLTEDEQNKEDEQARRRIEQWQKRAAQKEDKAEKGKDQDHEEPGIEVFLRACRFVNPRRERFRGRDVLVFDFEPNPEFKPRNLKEKIIQKLAGAVWIDETSFHVARLQASFVDDMKIAGGLLAKVQKGTNLVFEQAFINNEVWLPTYEEAHASVRVFLLKGLNVSHVTRYSDYKKFNVETVSNTEAKVGKR